MLFRSAVYWFALAGTLMKDGCKSLREVFDQLPRTRECRVSYTFLRQIPKHLAKLLRKSLNRENDVELYLSPWANSRKIVGLTADGLMVLQLAVDFLKANHPDMEWRSEDT